jgi:cytidine deaminase
MKKTEVKCVFTEFNTRDELSKDDQALLSAARAAGNSAYAPYSGFRVGAAVLLANGKIVSGSNQENVAFPSGLCAERVAVFSASADYPGVPVLAVAVTCRSEKFTVAEPVSPCGACRQALMEYENRYEKKIKLIMAGEKGKIIVAESVNELLPLHFDIKGLRAKKL